MSRFKGDGELAFKCRDRALITAEYLMEEDYVVMLSKEEDLIIVNYMWVEHADRSGAVLMRREDHEEDYVSHEAYVYLDNKVQQLEEELVEAAYSIEEYL